MLDIREVLGYMILTDRFLSKRLMFFQDERLLVRDTDSSDDIGYMIAERMKLTASFEECVFFWWLSVSLGQLF